MFVIRDVFIIDELGIIAKIWVIPHNGRYEKIEILLRADRESQEIFDHNRYSLVF